MTRLTVLFIFTTACSSFCAGWLAVAIIQEARDRSAAVEAVYRTGLKDGEAYTKGEFARALAERELSEEVENRIAKERL